MHINIINFTAYILYAYMIAVSKWYKITFLNGIFADVADRPRVAVRPGSDDVVNLDRGVATV